MSTFCYSKIVYTTETECFDYGKFTNKHYTKLSSHRYSPFKMHKHLLAIGLFAGVFTICIVHFIVCQSQCICEVLGVCCELYIDI